MQKGKRVRGKWVGRGLAPPPRCSPSRGPALRSRAHHEALLLDKRSLVHADGRQVVVLQTDASLEGLGGVLFLHGHPAAFFTVPIVLTAEADDTTSAFVAPESRP